MTKTKEYIAVATKVHEIEPDYWKDRLTDMPVFNFSGNWTVVTDNYKYELVDGWGEVKVTKI